MSQGRSSIDETEGIEAHTPGAQLRGLLRRGRSFSARERHCCYLNTGDPRFVNISTASGLNFPDDGRGLSAVDWDLDGDLDFWINNRNAPQVRFMRNDYPGNNHYVALRLEGKSCNRDAIGARVELTLREPNKQRKLIKTLHAGEGYLAQSSKWIHFGLGKSADIESVLVHWPGGNKESFRGCSADRRYKLVQDSGEVKEWSPPNRELKLKASPVQLPAPTKKARILLTSPSTIPNLHHETFERRLLPIKIPKTGALLINLWASWCRPCLVELKEFRESKSKFEAANLEVIALSVDGLGDDNSDAKKAQARWKQMEIPFKGGMATADLLDKFQLQLNQLFDLHDTILVPFSFLMDRQGRLGAIYKGPVSVEQLLKDVKYMELEGEERRRVAFPFPGKWATPIVHYRKLIVAVDMVMQGRIVDAVSYEKQNHSALSQDSQYHILLFNLGQAFTKMDKHEAAISYYLQALKFNPDLDGAHFNLGATYAMQNNFDKATYHFNRTIEINPDDLQSYLSLGKCYSSQGKLQEATRQYRKALKMQPDLSQANYELSICLAIGGNIDPAIHHYRLAMKKTPAYAGINSQKQFSQAVQMAITTLENGGAEQKNAAENIRNRYAAFQQELSSGS